jgi:spore coat polysaccharide biosynthesis protein SpsF
MGCFVLVPVRTESSRLPKKALLPIRKVPLILNFINRLKKYQFLEKIVVCTTELQSDDELVTLLKQNQIDVFRGSDVDILDRLYSAAIKHDYDFFVVAEGDDFFCDINFIKLTCHKLENTDIDFVYWKNAPFGSTPLGIKTERLGELIKKKKMKNTETGWGKFIVESGLFRVEIMSPVSKKLQRPDIRLSIDYREDFELAGKILEIIPRDFSLDDVIDVIDKNPYLLKINEKVKQKYVDNFEKKRVRLK